MKPLTSFLKKTDICTVEQLTPAQTFLRNAGKTLGIIIPTYVSVEHAYEFFARYKIDFYKLPFQFSTGRPKGDGAFNNYQLEDVFPNSTEEGLVIQGIFAYSDPCGGGKKDGINQPGPTHYERFRVNLNSLD